MISDIAMNFGSGSLFARCWRCGTLLGPSGSQAAARSAIGRWLRPVVFKTPFGSFWLMISSGVRLFNLLGMVTIVTIQSIVGRCCSRQCRRSGSKVGAGKKKTYLACSSTWAAEAMQLFLPTLEGMVAPVSDTSHWTKACDTGTEWDRLGGKFDSLVPLGFKTFALSLPSSKLSLCVHMCSLCLSDWHILAHANLHKMS